MTRLFISFSGGETSAFMAQWLKKNPKHYAEIIVAFANTGEENEATLEFVDRCDRHFGLDVVWVEAVVHHDKRASSTHRVVDFKTASRKGEPFEEVIRKYGIPNQSFPHCTRELKMNPLHDYIEAAGWEQGSYDTAIGIRADEINRISTKYEEKRIVYPLIEMIPMTKPRINSFWADMPFRLPLKGYEGNCKWCWKKSLRKHLTLLNENPDIYNFPERMEKAYGDVGPEFEKGVAPGYRRLFMRNSLPIPDMRRLAETTEFVPAEDDARAYPDRELFGLELDVSAGCSESCDIYHDGKQTREVA
jgi:hypothetical protein